MHPNATAIERFYTAFNVRDADAMAACYAPDVVFTDPAFGTLRGPEAIGMWRMLTGRSADLTVEASNISADDASGRAHWTASYTFSTGRPVVNEVDADFEFNDGLIIRHTDSFDFWRWSRQALGPIGLVLGWTPLLKAKVHSQARGQLDRFLAAP